MIQLLKIKKSLDYKIWFEVFWCSYFFKRLCYWLLVPWQWLFQAYDRWKEFFWEITKVVPMVIWTLLMVGCVLDHWIIVTFCYTHTHFKLWKLVDSETIVLEFVAIERQLVNIFTKALGALWFESLRKTFGIRLMYLFNYFIFVHLGFAFILLINMVHNHLCTASLWNF